MSDRLRLGPAVRRLACACAALAALVACDEAGPAPLFDNRIVFGVEQYAKADGQPAVRASYEVLRLGGRGSRVFVREERGRDCNLEDLDARVGLPLFESGRATFGGGALPPEGLTLLPTTDREHEITRDGAAFRDGDLLAFESTGFAAPAVDRVTFAAPPAHLEVTDPPAVGAITASGSTDLVVRWAHVEPPPPIHSAVLVALETSGPPRRELRCFFDPAALEGRLPADLVAQLRPTGGAGADAAASGTDAGAPSPSTPPTPFTSGATTTLRIASHEQVAAIRGDATWVIYAVATALQREQPVVWAR